MCVWLSSFAKFLFVTPLVPANVKISPRKFDIARKHRRTAVFRFAALRRPIRRAERAHREMN